MDKNAGARARILSLGLFRLLAVAAVLATSTAAYGTPAAPPDINGTFAGTLSGQKVCPSTSTPKSTAVNLTFKQSGSNFTFSGTGDNDNATGSGVISPSGAISGSFSTSSGRAGSFSGDLSGDSLTFSTSSSKPDACSPGVPDSEFLDGTLTRVASADITVNPATTPSSTLTTPLLLTTQVQSMTSDLGTRMSDVLHHVAGGPRRTASGFMYEGLSGLNAGDRVINYGAWASYAYTDFKNDLSSTAFNGDSHTALFGFDVAPWESVVFGVAVGYEHSDIDTGFNQGNQKTDGYTVAPYFGALLSDAWSVDFSFGYSNVNADQFRTLPGTTTRVTSSPDSDRWFGTLNVNWTKTYGDWILGARLGDLYAKNTQNSFGESDGTQVSAVDSELGQWNVGGNVAYSWGAFEPFASATYEHDYTLTTIAVTTGPQPSNDRDDVLMGAGIRYFGSHGISGNLTWNKRVGRQNYDEDRVNLTVRVDF